jgi:tagaturonate reductase
MSEVYRLWAIEGNEHVKNVLSFAQADEGVVIAPDIDIYRELKLRLLNGTHTLSCGVAFLAGCETVKQAMDDETVSGFISGLMQNEIAPSIPYEVELSTARSFGTKVLDRFRNPHIKHQWLSITMQYSSKMKMRCIPVLIKHYQASDTPPEDFALGFAAYICFMKPVLKKGEQYFGEYNGQNYLIQDDQAATFYKRWAGLSLVKLVEDVLRDPFWGEELYSLPGFQQAVTDKLNLILNNGMKEAIEATQAKKVFAA